MKQAKSVQLPLVQCPPFPGLGFPRPDSIPAPAPRPAVASGYAGFTPRAAARTELDCRPYEPADYGNVVALLERAYGGRLPGLEEFSCLRRVRSSPSRQVAVLRSNSEVIGFGGVVRYTNLDATGTRRLCLVIDPYRPLTRVIRMLHEALLDAVDEPNTRRVHCRVLSNSRLLLDDLAARGYSIVGGSIDLELDLKSVDLSPLDEQLETLRRSGIVIQTLSEHLGDNDERCIRYHRLWQELERMDPLYGATLNSPLKPFLAWLKNPRRDFDGCYVALADGVLVGTSLLVPVAGDESALEQKATGVLPAYRRRGIATALKLCAIRSARQRGISTIFTQNSEEEGGVLALNRRLGFREIRNFRLLEADYDLLRAGDAPRLAACA